jgi:hypothetical protein
MSVMNERDREKASKWARAEFRRRMKDPEYRRCVLAIRSMLCDVLRPSNANDCKDSPILGQPTARTAKR